MNKRYLLLIILSLFAILSYAQKELNMIDQLNLKADIVAKIERINGLLKKEDLLKEIHKFQLFHVFWLQYKGEFEKEDFINRTFLNKLYPAYYTHKTLFGKKKYLQSEAYIGDSTGKLIATSGGQFIQSEIRYKVPYAQNDIELFNMFYKKELDFVFYIYGTCWNYFIGVKGKEIYVFENNDKGLNVYKLDEFVNCCWDQYYHR